MMKIVVFYVKNMLKINILKNRIIKLFVRDMVKPHIIQYYFY